MFDRILGLRRRSLFTVRQRPCLNVCQMSNRIVPSTSCMSAPKEHNRPGTPAPPILAGELLPSGKQCELAGYNPDAWTCWDTTVLNRASNCNYLRCSNPKTWGVTCGYVGWTLDGTYCNAEITNPLYQKDGFLAGEETPVWVATFHPQTRQSDESYDFQRVTPNESPSIIRRALNYWGSLKKGSGFPFSKKRSIDDHANLTYIEQFDDGLSNVEIKRFDSPSLVQKRSTSSIEVVYPSVLVVMDYETSRSLEEQVLYALAFWGTVDTSLRIIQNPRVSLRIAGIVITATHDVTPYLTTYLYGLPAYTFASAVKPMVTYWKSMSERVNSDFPIGSYDIVAHMTNINPSADGTRWRMSHKNTPRNRKDGFRWSRHPKPATNYFAGVAAKKLCKFADRPGVVIFRDDFHFDGISRAIVQMGKVLGGTDTLPYHKEPSRKWTKNVLDTVSNGLTEKSCMSAPKEYHLPGAPIEQILAGELVPNEKLCELAGYNSDAWTCWDTHVTSRRSTCSMLQCSNAHIWGVTCRTVARPLDGSFCNVEKTKICLHQECVDKI